MSAAVIPASLESQEGDVTLVMSTRGPPVDVSSESFVPTVTVKRCNGSQEVYETCYWNGIVNWVALRTDVYPAYKRDSWPEEVEVVAKYVEKFMRAVAFARTVFR